MTGSLRTLIENYPTEVNRAVIQFLEWVETANPGNLSDYVDWNIRPAPINFHDWFKDPDSVKAYGYNLAHAPGLVVVKHGTWQLTQTGTLLLSHLRTHFFQRGETRATVMKRLGKTEKPCSAWGTW